MRSLRKRSHNFCSRASIRPPDGHRRWYSARKGPLSEAAACIFIYIETKAALGTSTFVGEGDHPWTIDFVTVTAAAILVVGFVGALVAHLVR